MQCLTNSNVTSNGLVPGTASDTRASPCVRRRASHGRASFHATNPFSQTTAGSKEYRYEIEYASHRAQEETCGPASAQRRGVNFNLTPRARRGDGHGVWRLRA